MKTKKFNLGDIFLIEKEIYILAQVSNCAVAMIGLKSGNRWTEPIKISYNEIEYGISHDIVITLIGNNKFKRTKIASKKLLNTIKSIK